MDWTQVLNFLSNSWAFVVDHAPAFLSGGLVGTLIAHKLEIWRERRAHKRMQLDALAAELPRLQGWLDAYYNFQLFDGPAPAEPWPIDDLRRIITLYFPELELVLKQLNEDAANLKLWAINGKKERAKLRVAGTNTLPAPPQEVINEFSYHWYKVDAASKELLIKCGEIMKKIS